MSAKVTEIARSWLGTPYVDQASVKGAGADCLGLVRGIWRELHGAEPAAVPSYTPDWGEVARRESLLDAASDHLVRIPGDQILLGSVLLFRMRSGAMAKHLGIVTRAGEEPKFIHAYSGVGVVESALSTPWRRRVVATFHFP